MRTNVVTSLYQLDSVLLCKRCVSDCCILTVNSVINNPLLRHLSGYFNGPEWYKKVKFKNSSQ